VVPSSNVPVATSCCELANGTVGFAGVTEIETRFAFDTVREEAELVTVPDEAEILVKPGAAASAKPCVPGEELMLAIVDWVEFHATCDVMSDVVPSLYLPLAVNCWIVPFAIFALAGTNRNSRQLRDHGENRTYLKEFATNRVLNRPGDDDPPRADAATPWLLMVATVVSPLTHVSWPVMSCGLPKLY
jgi:hypothetical protein